MSLLQAYTYQVSVNPSYIQEGLNTTLTTTVQAANNTTYYFKINVTVPNGVSYTANISVTTNAVGFGVNSTKYWGNFSGAHTNLVGVYNILLKNATTDANLHSANFSVGLTDKLAYRRNEDVRIRGSGYNASENATINMKTNGNTVAGYPKNATANTQGVISNVWRVPINATLGNYTVTITNATTTVKPVSDTWNFTVFGISSYSVEAQPRRIQEGKNTTITVTINDAAVNTVYALSVNVTDPRGNVYNASLLVSTNATGFGSNSIQYWGNFNGANTHYVGIYNVSALNETLATTTFAVALTDKLEYRRNETVQIQAAGYKTSELVKVDLRFEASSVATFPKNWTASSRGELALTWKVPLNATRGTYNLTFTPFSGGTVKTPRDTQAFNVSGVMCRIQTKNLANTTVGGVSVEVYKAETPNSTLLSGKSNATGWTVFNLDGGNYTFKAFWKDVEVRLLNQTVKEDTNSLNITLQLKLTNIRIIVKDARAGLPLIDLRFSYNYTTRANKTESAPSVSLKTNMSGTAEVDNVFTNVSYVLEATRYDFPLPGSPWRNDTLPLPWNNLTIVVPTYTAFIQVFDAKGSPVSGQRIEVYEWSSGTTQPMPDQLNQTDVGGNLTLLLTFGKYRLRAFKDSLLLNETVLNLIENNLNFTFRLSIFRMDVTVWVQDYFGQPIANANVTIERKIGEEYVFAYSRLTGADGSIKFSSVIGGDSRISVYVAGRLAEVKTQFLDANSNLATFKIGEYIALMGYPIETGLFALFSFILVLAVVLVLVRGLLIKAVGKKSKG